MSPCAPLGGRDEVKLPKGSKIDKRIYAACSYRASSTFAGIRISATTSVRNAPAAIADLA